MVWPLKSIYSTELTSPQPTSCLYLNHCFFWKGGGSRGSSSRGSYSRGSYSRGSSSRGSSSRVSSYKKSKAKKAISTLKKAAVIGVGAYAAYKVAKATKKFAKRVFEGPKFEYNTWNSYRRADGYLCREDIHCNWLDRNFECQTVKDFSWTPIVSFIAPKLLDV